MLMVSNQSRPEFHWAAGAHPGRIGHLFTAGQPRAIYPWMPYALDNGAFGAWKNGTAWSATAYLDLLEWATKHPNPPRWVLCPDSVGNRDKTLNLWREWYPRLREYGWPVAFAAQDGMTPADVPAGADVVFIGGSTRWKWRSVREWCRTSPRVHVGRVNGERALRLCVEFGAGSCDGTGWWVQARGRREQLLSFLDLFERGWRSLPYDQLRLAGVR